MTELMDKFLNQALTAEETAQFLELLKNKTWLEKAYTEVLLQEAFAESKDNAFRQILDEITYEYPYRQLESKKPFIDAFIPVKYYEENLEGITRTSEIQVLQPILEANYTHYLPFRLENSLPQNLILIVENNDYDELLRQKIPAKSIAFYIDLPTEKGFGPGRYYWKLASERHQVSAMGVFFIGKDLMSS